MVRPRGGGSFALFVVSLCVLRWSRRFGWVGVGGLFLFFGAVASGFLNFFSFFFVDFYRGLLVCSRSPSVAYLLVQQ